MIDFHSHILPNLDDGSSGNEETMKMLHMSMAQRVEYIVATPHFYAQENTPEQFLIRRKKAWEALRPSLKSDMPKILLGAEVLYYEGLSISKDLSKLYLEGTHFLLLEMPFMAWNERIISNVIDINCRENCSVVLAHIERYLPFQQEKVWEELYENRILMQSNASFFINRKTRKKALQMFQSGQIHFLGSDCHNTTDRKPNLGTAKDVICLSLGKKVYREYENNVVHLIGYCEDRSD